MEREILYGNRANYPITTRSLARSFLFYQGDHSNLLAILKKYFPINTSKDSFWKDFLDQLKQLQPPLVERNPTLQEILRHKIELIEQLLAS